MFVLKLPLNPKSDHHLFRGTIIWSYFKNETFKTVKTILSEHLAWRTAGDDAIQSQQAVSRHELTAASG
jgi:hypothetical protein